MSTTDSVTLPAMFVDADIDKMTLLIVHYMVIIDWVTQPAAVPNTLFFCNI